MKKGKKLFKQDKQRKKEVYQFMNDYTEQLNSNLKVPFQWERNKLKC